MKKHLPILFVAVLLFASAGLLAFIVFKDRTARKATSVPRSAIELRRAYEANVRATVLQYRADLLKADVAKAKASAKSAEQRLLDTVTPPEYRDAHLELVLYFHSLSTLTDTMPGADYDARFAEIAEKAPFLK